jgi:Nucleotidyl transferase AbiEii toxin, Type IV TA system
MIAKGLITQRANDEQLPAQTIERDYILANICSDIGVVSDSRLVLKGGTLLRLCYFADYRYSADLDFSAIDGLTAGDAVALVADAVDAVAAGLGSRTRPCQVREGAGRVGHDCSARSMIRRRSSRGTSVAACTARP